MKPQQAITNLRKLVALATHAGTPEHEARNAAVKACKLISELREKHGLVFALETKGKIIRCPHCLNTLKVPR